MSSNPEITIDVLKHICELAKIKVTDEEASRLINELKSIIEFINKINELPLENITPMYYPVEEHYPVEIYERTAADIPDEPYGRELIKLAPSKDAFYVHVPKFLPTTE